MANVQTNSKIKVISTSGKVVSEVISDGEK
ncbi:MAG: hypothetical protein IPF54_20155 [Draconibacterium sp.]|nr:hypothetical protein [Draconibacterium sp.]